MWWGEPQLRAVKHPASVKVSMGGWGHPASVSAEGGWGRRRGRREWEGPQAVSPLFTFPERERFWIEMIWVSKKDPRKLASYCSFPQLLFRGHSPHPASFSLELHLPTHNTFIHKHIRIEHKHLHTHRQACTHIPLYVPAYGLPWLLRW